MLVAQRGVRKHAINGLHSSYAVSRTIPSYIRYNTIQAAIRDVIYYLLAFGDK